MVSCWGEEVGGAGLLRVQQPAVAFDAGLEVRELAVGGALRSLGHPSGGGELHEGFGDAEGLRVVLAPLVEGGEPLVGVAPYKPFGDARLVEVDRPLRVAVDRKSVV